MNIAKSTEKYEGWLGERIPLIRTDLNRKHALMKEGPFAFLRAVFYRWAQTWPELCADAFNAPLVLGIGDLHVENFGTWRDAEGRLVWGINNFDEACWIPYTGDLVRLTTSAHLAIQTDHLRMISPLRASKAILEGYNDGLRAHGQPYVLGEHHHALHHIAIERLKEPQRFWDKLNALKSIKEEVPSSAVKALRKMLPEPDLQHRIVHRVSGLGSLGRRRYVALARWHGSSIAREAKELTTSAWLWARSSLGRKASGICYEELLEKSVRCRDPFVCTRGRWLVRRLAPDCSRIELSSLPDQHDAVRLLHAMGFETANIHLGSRDAQSLGQDLSRRGSGWLHTAAQSMVQSVMDDWNDWRKLG